MSKNKTTRVRRRLNPAVYTLITGVIFVAVGFLWIKVVDILIAIDGFGLGEVVKLLPYAGYATIALGALLIFVNLIRMVISKPVVSETVPVKRKKTDPSDIHETSKFEKKYIKGLILDLDGTLLHTLEDLTEAANNVLLTRGYKAVSSDLVRMSLGNGIKNLMRQIMPADAEESEVDEAYQDMVMTYAQNYMNKTRPYEGINDMLQQLTKRGYLMAVISNKKDEFVQQLVKKHFPDILFVDVIGERSDYPRKPDPKLARMIADKMMLPLTQLAIVGDSEVDIQTAKNSKMYSYAVTWGYRSQEDLELAQPDVFINTPAELVMQLDMMNTQELIENEPEQSLEETKVLKIEDSSKL